MSTFELDALWKSTDAGPVTLLNLVKYRDRSNDGQGTGREAYTRHTDVARAWWSRAKHLILSSKTLLLEPLPGIR